MTKPSKPLVSVIVAVRNGERFIASAIQSILDQDYRPVEILVVDGRSEDRTAAIARSFTEVCFLVQRSRGIADAYNTGIEAARGEFVSFLSHDDIWLPQKLSLQVNYLLEHPDIQYTIAMMKYFREPGHEIPQGFRTELLERPHVGRIMETLLARRSLFAAIGGFDSAMALAEDADWYARASDGGVPMAVIPEVLLHKRLHDRNAASDAQTSCRELLKALKRSIDRKKNRGAGDGRNAF
jgi:glycosyltransferase involved in cell wall biosynthesis